MRTSVVLPAREEAATVGPIVETCVQVADQVLVVDAGSADGTAEVAERAGADVVQEAGLLPGFGPVLGKGDAMWRALSVVTGDAVVYLDADAAQVDERFVREMVAPLTEGAQFVKAHYRRPFKGDPEGGGRVTELTARPLLRAFYPELAEIRQPLAGETAARRELLERLPFTTGYGVEIALLIDAWKEAGPGAIAQVDLGVRDNRHQPLSALGRMADEVLAAVTVRLERDGRLRSGERATELVERPPLVSV